MSRLIVDYFPVVAFLAGFVLPLALAACEGLLTDSRAQSKGFFGDPGTWVYKIILIPVGAIAFSGLVHSLVIQQVERVYFGVALGIALGLAIRITVPTCRRWRLVKVGGSDDATNENLGVTAAWHDYWWAWKAGRRQIAATYNNFIVFPAMFFFAAVGMVLTAVLPFIILHLDPAARNQFLPCAEFGNLLIVLIGIGMVFNLKHYQEIYRDFSVDPLVVGYICIYLVAAFLSTWSLYLVDPLKAGKMILAVTAHAVPLTGLAAKGQVADFFPLREKAAKREGIEKRG